MKEPWQVFLDEFRTEVARKTRVEREGEDIKKRMSSADLRASIDAATEATVYHLVENEDLSVDQALTVIEEFHDGMLEKPGGYPAWSERLKNIWTDFQLRSRQTRDSG